jgi:NAD(P)-dependent dehydrogenase (short-subunit alcohol dehydrogenase family)
MIRRTALVTGASRGLGQAIAQLLEESGYSVLRPTRSEMDLASTVSIDSYLASVVEPIEILVNDAGINRVAALGEIGSQDLQDTLDINLSAPFHLIQSVTPQMRKTGFGRIVNISSIWSIVSRAGRITYSMSKSALNGMTRSIAIELAPFNILVNAVAPGYVLTDLTRQNNSDEELMKISKAIPLQRLASPDEIASVVAFLCSEQNTYMTGQTVVVDGGFSCL